MVLPRFLAASLLVCFVLFSGGALSAAPGAHFLFSEDKSLFDFGFTMMHGQVKEHVYILGNSYLLSRLDWDVTPLRGITFGAAHKFDASILSASFMIALPGRSGLIKNYDWAESEGGAFLANDVWSHYSEHPNYIASAFRIDLDWIFNWTGGERWRLDYFFGLMWQRISFDAYDGFYQYPPSGSGRPPPSVDPVPLTGLVVSYQTDQILPVFGLMYSRLLGNDFAISSLLKLGGIGFQRAYDQHHLRDIDFFDYYIFQPYIELRQSFAIDFGKGLGSECTFFLICYPKAYGWSYIKDLRTQEVFRSAGSAAASSYFIGGEVNLQFSF